MNIYINTFMTNSHITQHLLQRMHEVTLPWLYDQNFTHIITFAFNRNTTLTSGRSTLKNLHARLDRSLLGSKWFEKPKSERSMFIAYPEHMTSNLHYNMLLKVDPTNIDKATKKIPQIWSNLVSSGSTDVKLTSEAHDLINLFSYQIKEQAYSSKSSEAYILSNEFLS